MAENKTFDLVIHHSDADGYCSAALVSLTQSAFGNTYAVFCSVEHGENDKILDKIKNSIDMITDSGKIYLNILYNKMVLLHIYQYMCHHHMHELHVHQELPEDLYMEVHRQFFHLPNLQSF